MPKRSQNQQVTKTYLVGFSDDAELSTKNEINRPSHFGGILCKKSTNLIGREVF